VNALADPALLVVTPVYEDREAAAILLRELRSSCGAGLQVIAVDDGSVRDPLTTAEFTAAGVGGALLVLKRNVGHQRAIAIGLSYAAEYFPGRRVVVMDSDGEDAPQSIPDLLAAHDAGNVDVVVARRRHRAEGLRFRAFYLVYKALFALLTGRGIAFGNFMLLSPAAVARLVAMQELWIHVAGCVLTSRLRVRECPLDRSRRYAGSSRMNFVALALHGVKALMVFAEDVLVRVGIACALVAALSVLGVIIAIVLKAIGFATPGWFSVALGIMLLVFMQTGALTLMTLMLTGVVRSGSVANIAWREFVAEVERSDGAA
jgi:glycosyltransferase involved in cell wall biosynthesis